MNYNSLLKDTRKRRGVIWNVRDVLKHYTFGRSDAPWNKCPACTDEAWIDEFVYQGFAAHGRKFLNALRGRFAIAYVDCARGQLFLARDWIGEQPFHYLATLDGFIVANTVMDLRLTAGSDYAYAYVRAFPQAHFQLIDMKEVRPAAVSSTLRLSPPELYYDFAQAVEERRNENTSANLESTCRLIRDRLQASVAERAAIYKARPLFLLLSGGLDSFSVALTLKSAGVAFEAVTLSVKDSGGDLTTAKEFAKHLGLKHHVLSVEPGQVTDAFEEAVRVSECYHLFNIYCAVGMHLIGEMMRQRGFGIAFCGEAVNEALGDYHDWSITDSRTGREILLQRINSERLGKIEERVAYTWGKSADAGLYNRQLGTGLAKHAGSRMFKPFHSHGLTLESPYYDKTVLQSIVSIPAEVLKQLGGKPGLFSKIFERDMRQNSLSKQLIAGCKKVRFQDASETGEGGITSVLYQNGWGVATFWQR